jgi:hypothetical protein
MEGVLNWVLYFGCLLEADRRPTAKSLRACWADQPTERKKHRQKTETKILLSFPACALSRAQRRLGNRRRCPTRSPSGPLPVTSRYARPFSFLPAVQNRAPKPYLKLSIFGSDQITIVYIYILYLLISIFSQNLSGDPSGSVPVFNWIRCPFIKSAPAPTGSCVLTTEDRARFRRFGCIVTGPF